ncbi:lysosomal acid glucosylceramidase-like [Palaemon carinicauda]|uniref:lysosomal acid glucosylceramidase-like n=1 Tax=Palaemon carinicauda TaxID=392227 RepID=UPI0035B63B19
MLMQTIWTPVMRVISSFLFLYNGMDGTSGCLKESFGADSFACVCNKDHCDDFPQVILRDGHFQQIVSSKLAHRFEPFEGLISDAPLPGNPIININLEETLQTMKGFGGAFTDSTGINIADLSEPMQEKLLRSYFAPTGIEYTMGRIIIASSDYSKRKYSYDEVEGDMELEHFALAPEDHSYKLPFIKRALAMSKRPLLLFGAPWSPPTWMRETDISKGEGGIKREMWQVWSDYIVKFVESYESEGISLWGLSAQDEAMLRSPWHGDGCKWSATDMRDWIKTSLGPALEAAGYGGLQLMVLDHDRDGLPWYPKTILDDPDAYKYVDGIGIHWYEDETTGPEALDAMHEHYPEKFILYTESSIGGKGPVLGSWEHAERFVHNIIEDVNHWTTGWLEWNMVLDMQGGPSWAKRSADAPIVVKKEKDTFYKQPLFYAMGHFSKYVTDGDVRVSYSIAPSVEGLEVTSFLKTSGEVVVVLMNTSEDEHSITIKDNKGSVLNLNLEARSLNTVLYKPVAKKRRM